VSQIFGRFVGLNRRKLIQTSVARPTEQFAAKADELSTSGDYATALTIVGYESLLGSIGASLVAVLEEGAPSRLCEMSFIDALPRTGVTYVERVARKEYSVEG
jgi:hypothetical protein